MRKTLRPTRWTVIHYTLLLSLLAAAILISDSAHPLRVKLQHSVFDQFNALHTRPATNKVLIVDIDEKSLEVLGQWPWPRNIMADLTQSLAEKGAKVIAFDGVFAEEDRSSPHKFFAELPEEDIQKLPAIYHEQGVLKNYDEIFARTIKQSKIFVTAFTYGRADRTKTIPVDKKRILAKAAIKDLFKSNAAPFNAAAVNLPIFSKAAAGNGSFMAKPDKDGILRRTALIFTDGEILYPSLSLEALRVALLGRKGTIKIGEVPLDERKDVDTGYRLIIGNKNIPIENDGILYVHYRHFCTQAEVTSNPQICPKSDYLPAHMLLNPAYDQETKATVKDKIILIGASAEGLKDLRSTALSPYRPGVEVHANVIEQILDNDYLLRPDVTKGVEALFIFCAGLLFIIVSPFIGIIVSITFCAILMATAFGAAYIAYVDHGLLIDPVYPSLAVLTIFIASTILSYVSAELKRKQIRNAFGMYVANAVIKDLERNPDKLKLGGEIRDLTVMFTDIRKFTAISEGLSAEELINLMNDFLTNMTDIVMEHNGTVDKYIGDAMMTFWNAPLDVKNHEREACLAALKMQNALEPINERIKQEAEKNEQTPVLLKAGIGINTGECAVGNMGSRQRFAYSALGDAVNMASRLEGQTKHYGVPILVGQSTYEKADGLALIEVDKIQVIGKEESVRIYALCGDSQMLESQDFQNWREQHKNFIASYRSAQFEDASEKLKIAKKAAPTEYHELYAMYRKRINTLKNKELPVDWDGTYVATSK